MTLPANKKHSRNADILDLQAKGLSYRQIASMVGISAARVGAIVKRDWGNGLSHADVEAFLATINHLEHGSRNSCVYRVFLSLTSIRP